MTPTTLDDLLTPAAVVDLDRMAANLDRMAAYVSAHGLGLRPHTKTHKTPELAIEQLGRGAAGITVATVHEAAVMSAVADDILIAHPPVSRPKLDRLVALPESLRLTVALDSEDALAGLDEACRAAERTVGVLIELDLGMRRVGVSDLAQAVALARGARDRRGVELRGILFYPGHIREPVGEQDPALDRLRSDIDRFVDLLDEAGLTPAVVSGGSTPAAYRSHELATVTEIRPGTYIFNDRTTYAIDACARDDCAYTVLATVVSTAVGGQAVVDAGSKALAREELRGPDASGFGELLDRPDVVVKAMSEEHGLLDLSRTGWRPRVGERVRIIPNHVCVSVNLHPRLWAVRGERIENCWTVGARSYG